MKYYTIKSIIYTIVCVILFASCQNEAIEIQEQIEVVISPSKVLQPFEPYQSSDLEMEVDEELGTAKLRITALIYDSEGNLVDCKEELLKDYNSDFTFQIVMNPDEEYKLLAFSSAVFGALGDIKYESYSFAEINKLNTLSVSQVRADSYYSNTSVLGVCDATLKSDKDTFFINLKPATALVNLNWKNIHALHNFESDEIWGTYSATAVDMYENSYSWEISISAGDEPNEVFISNFSPLLVDLGFTSDQEVNIYSGYISGDKLIIPNNQQTGVNDDSYDVMLVGINPETFAVEDIVISIDRNARVLTVESVWGTYSEKGEGGFYELFDKGVEFVSKTGNMFEYEKYYIIYHNNDIVKYDDGTFIYSTSLDKGSNRGDNVTPSNNPDAKNIYAVHNLLPGSFSVFARTFIGNHQEDYNLQTVTIESGKQYVFKFDCAELELNITSGQLKSAMGMQEYYSPSMSMVTSTSVFAFPEIHKADFADLKQLLSK